MDSVPPEGASPQDTGAQAPMSPKRRRKTPPGGLDPRTYSELLAIRQSLFENWFEDLEAELGSASAELAAIIARRDTLRDAKADLLVSMSRLGLPLERTKTAEGKTVRKPIREADYRARIRALLDKAKAQGWLRNGQLTREEGGIASQLGYHPRRMHDLNGHFGISMDDIRWGRI